jgi:hypothetical protein
MIVVPVYPEYGDISVLPAVNGKAVSGLKADLGLTVIAPNQSEYLVPFRIDAGAGCSTISSARAERLGLFRPDDVIAEVKFRTATGEAIPQTVRLGKVWVRLPFLRPEPFEWPILFLTTKPLSSPCQLGMPTRFGWRSLRSGIPFRRDSKFEFALRYCHNFPSHPSRAIIVFTSTDSA